MRKMGYKKKKKIKGIFAIIATIAMIAPYVIGFIRL